MRPEDRPAKHRDQLISSLMDTWLVLESHRIRGERTRFLWVIKSRGMSHSGFLHELHVKDDGLGVGPPREGLGSAEHSS